MPLASGAKLGRYEIRKQLGAGGMGEVYLAYDPKIGRDVAIKVIPAAFSADVARLRRFEQEVQAAGRLNHPNILAVYDVDTHDGTPYVVCELLEGESLRERLSGAALPTRKVIDYALQITHGLSAAHEKGIVHRDLKPENIFITKDGQVKILDFGLAKLVQPQFADTAQTDVPTVPLHSVTGSGVVLGTVGYMSPEQVRGEKVDHRSDIFSFGIVLYEMLAGERPFQRDTAVETLNAILKEDPPELSGIDRNVNPALERVMRHCLEKNPLERFQSAHDLAFALEALSETTLSAQTVAPTVERHKIRRERLAWLLAVLFFLTTLALVVFPYFQRAQEETKAASFLLYPPEKATFSYGDLPHTAAVSPDGRQLAFVATLERRTQIWLRPLDKVAAEPLANTEGAQNPFWSPDGHYIAFFAGGKLKKIAATGGATTTLCDAAPYANSGTWSKDGVILFTQSQGEGGIYRVSATGGEATQVLKLNESRHEIYYFWPHFLPDGHHFLFLLGAAQREESAVCVGSLDTGETRRLAQANSRAFYAPPGYLLYLHDGALVAQPFDAGAQKLAGEPVTVAEHIRNFSPTGNAQFSVSLNGEVLIYQTGGNISRLAWTERNGTEVGSVGAPADYGTMRLSPDGQELAVDIVDARDGTNDIWIFDLTRGNSTRFTFDMGQENAPVWSPGGRRIIYSHDPDGPPHLYQKSLNDTGESGEMLLPMNNKIQTPLDWSADGRFIIYREYDPKTKFDLLLLPMTGEHQPSVLLRTPFNESAARLSADGRLLAYVSDESGRDEVYVRFVQGDVERWQVSNSGGHSPRWRHDGQELFYISGDLKLMAVPVKIGDKFEAGTPTALFKIAAKYGEFDVMPDGKRFLINSIADTPPQPLTVVTVWAANLKH
jgi:serine/threonine protein kinase/Tol biopolymer transport system component